MENEFVGGVLLPEIRINIVGTVRKRKVASNVTGSRKPQTIWPVTGAPPSPEWEISDKLGRPRSD
ncbi:MAG: hypothetical protein FJW26_17155 [Acidimicrobiia bacterium]|nr:hypothetical protein [Acidimicrobiia bacterium]